MDKKMIDVTSGGPLWWNGPNHRLNH